MDKLRAIQYFNRAVEAGSFAAAARAFDVSTPAVTQLVAALERSLGVQLFHRTPRGLSLTPDGERYYETSRKVEAELLDAEQRLGPRGTKPRGTLTVGMRPALGRNCVMSRITRFLARFPDIELVTKPVGTFQDLDKADIDIVVMAGWPPDRHLIARPLAQTRLLVCASPDYWNDAGRPDDPEALRNHQCLVYRGTSGALLDRWSFQKGDERRTVDVGGRLLSDDRVWIEEAACAGAGVARLPDLTISRYLSSGSLVPVLTEWEGLEAPMIFAAYPPRLRQSKLVGVFLDFLTEVFAELDASRLPAPTRAITRVPRPEWFGRTRGRHSAYVARRRKSN